MSSSIRITNVSKRFKFVPLGGRRTLKEGVVGGLFHVNHERKIVEALSDVSFSVDGGQVLGVVGRNGSGKTTLMRLLAGVYSADEGTVEIEGGVTPLLALGAGFHPDLTGRENARIELLVLGLTPRDIEKRMDEIIEFSEIGRFIDVPIRAYSAGMVMRLAFSAAMSVDPDILLLDEVLAVGDEGFAAKCKERIGSFKRHGKTIVLVSHNIESIVAECDVALWLDHGRVGALGDPRTVVDAYCRSLESSPVG